MPSDRLILQNIVAFAVLVAAIIGVWYFGVHKPSLQNPSVPKPILPQNQGETPPPQYPTGNGGTNGGNGTQTGNTPPTLDENKQLKKGAKGDEVKALQTLCNKIIGKINASMDDTAGWAAKFGTTPKPTSKIAALVVDGSFVQETQTFLTDYLAAASFYTTLKIARAQSKIQYGIE